MRDDPAGAEPDAYAHGLHAALRSLGRAGEFAILVEDPPEGA
jgi:hypothetical protein